MISVPEEPSGPAAAIPPPPSPDQRVDSPASSHGSSLFVAVRARDQILFGSAVFLASSAACLGQPLGGRGALLALAAMAAVLATVWHASRSSGGWSVSANNAVTVAAGSAAALLPALVLRPGAVGFLAFLVSPLVVLMVSGMALFAVFQRWRQGLAAIAIMVIATGLVGVGWTHELTVRRLQVRIAEPSLRADINSGDSHGESEGVHGWIWVGGIPDGGLGVAYDPSDRMAEDDFAAEIWHNITGDPGHCDLLYDHWFWCG